MPPSARYKLKQQLISAESAALLLKIIGVTRKPGGLSGIANKISIAGVFDHMQSALKRSHDAAGPVSPTPTSNRSLPQDLAGFQSLAEGLDYAARGVTGFNFYSARGELQSVLSYADLRRQAVATARKLLSLGLKRGERVAVVAETGPDFMAVFFGCQYAGLHSLPDALHHVYRRQGFLHRARRRHAGGGEGRHRHRGRGSSRPHHRGCCARRRVPGAEPFGTRRRCRRPPPSSSPSGPDEEAYIQYSSGSTSNPKGVLISQKAIIANARGILREGLKLTPEDRAFSWLPLYHDMGLVGFCLSPMLGQVTVDFLATTSFARRPALWLKLMSDNSLHHHLFAELRL